MRVKLSDVTKYLKGTQINGDDLIENGEYIYLNGGINPSGRWNAANVKGNTVTISEGGNSSGYVNYVTEPFWCGAHCYYLFDGPKNTRYLYYALKSQQERLFDIRSGACMPNIKKADLGKFEFEFDTDEQKQSKIVSVLSKIEVVISERKRELDLLDELIKARFVELFGDLASPDCKWDREKMIDICENPEDIKCGPFGTQLSKDEYVNTGVAVWEIPQINSFFSTTPTHYLTEEKAKQLESYSIKPYDIAMSRKGNVGKCAVFPSTFEPGIIHSDVLRIRVDNKRVLPLFMMHQLHYSGAVQQQIELVSSGAIMAGINVTKLKHIFVHIPPIEQQQQFVSFVTQIDKSKFTKICTPLPHQSNPNHQRGRETAKNRVSIQKL